MNRSTKHFVEICSKSLPVLEPIYEFGSRQMPGQEGYADLRNFFKDKNYIGADYIEGVGVDIVLDLHNIDLPSESVGTIICMEVLEHVEFPFQAINEMLRVLKPGGLLIISAPMKLSIHGSPHDYWRFTPEGFKTLLKPLQQSFVGFCGDIDFPDAIVGIGVKGKIISLDKFEQEYKIWQKVWTKKIPQLKKIIGLKINKFIPSILTGSSFELWLRQRTNPEYNEWKGLIKLCLPPIVKRLWMRIK